MGVRKQVPGRRWMVSMCMWDAVLRGVAFAGGQHDISPVPAGCGRLSPHTVGDGFVVIPQA